MDKKFSLYLTKIGLFDEKTSNEIIKSYKQSENQKFEDSSFHYLMNFFDNLNEEQKKYMSFYIPNNYQQITNQIKVRKLKSIFVQTLLRQRFKLLKYLNKWRKSKNNINVSGNFMNIYKNEENHKSFNEENDKLTKILQANQNNISLDDYLLKEKINMNGYNYRNNHALSNIKHIVNHMNTNEYKYNNNERIFNKVKNRYRNPYYSNNSNLNPYQHKVNCYNLYNFNHRKPDYKYICRNLYQSQKSKKDSNNKLLSSLEAKELEDLKECTFKPKINIISQKHKNNNSSQIKNKSKEKENLSSIFDKLYKDEEKNKLSKELRAIDKEYNLGKTFSFTPNLNNKFKTIYKYEDHRNFVDRQKEFKEKLDKKRLDLKYQIESQNDLLCSFNPKITNEKGEYYKPKKKGEKKEKKSKSVFKRLYSDVKSRQELQEQREKENNDKFDEMANYLTLDKKVDESDLIERLYEDKRDDIINKTREKVEKEEGVTFQPDIGDDEYYQNIDSTFLERNEELINKKKNFIEEENAKQIENLKNYGNKKYTSEEREEIINNIIERLYKSSLKNKKENNEESEENNEEENEDDGKEEDYNEEEEQAED